MSIRNVIKLKIKEIGSIISFPIRYYLKLRNKRRFVFILITLIILVGIYFLYGWLFGKRGSDSNVSNLPFPQIEAISLTTGDIFSSIKLSGVSKLENEQTLKFAKAAKIVSVSVRAGMKVKKGDILAMLDQSEISSRIQRARTTYEKAKRDLDDLLDGKDKTEVLSAEYDLQQQEINLDKAKDELKYSLDTKDTRLGDAKIKLNAQEKLYLIEKTKYDLEMKTFRQKNIEKDKLAYENVKRDYIRKFKDKLREIKNIISSLDITFKGVDEYLGVKKTFDNELPDYFIYFSAKQSGYKSLAKNSLENCYSSLKKIEKIISNIEKVNPDMYHMKLFIPIYDEFKVLYKYMYTLGDKFSLAAKNSVESEKFSESLMDSLESKGISIRESASEKLSKIDEDIDSLKLAISLDNDNAQKKISYFSQLEEYEKKKMDFLKSKINYQEEIHKYEQLQKDVQRDISEKRLAVKIAENILLDKQNKLSDIKKGYTDEELQNAKDVVENAKTSLEAVNEERENYYLRATFDGTVRKVNMQIGDNLTEDNDKNIVLENRDLIKVEMQADQSDILKLKKGQYADIRFDAFPNTIFKGEIIEINETPQRIDNIVKYQVVASVKNISGTKVFSDMSAVVDVIVSGKKGILTLPVTAIGYDDQGSYVLNALDDTKIYVTVGDQSSDVIQIVSGLDLSTKVKSTVFNSQAIKEMGIVKGKKKDDQDGDMESYRGDVGVDVMY